MTSNFKNKHASAFANNCSKANASLDLARIYLDDGALRTAAKHFREAADSLDAAASSRDAFIEGTVDPTPEAKRKRLTKAGMKLLGKGKA